MSQWLNKVCHYQPRHIWLYLEWCHSLESRSDEHYTMFSDLTEFCCYHMCVNLVAERGEDWFCRRWRDNDRITMASWWDSWSPLVVILGDHISDILTCLTALEAGPWYNRSTRHHWSTWRPCNTRSALFGPPGPPAFLQSNTFNHPVAVCWILRFSYSSCGSNCCRRGRDGSKRLFHSEYLLLWGEAHSSVLYQ